MNKSIHSKKYQIYIRAESEFNVQADLYAKLRNALSEFGFQIFGEVRLMGEEKIGGARRQKGRLDLAIFYKSKIICAIEVKNKKIKGINRQIRLYEKLGVSKLFVCVGKGEIDHTVKCCKKFCKDWITPKLTLKRNKLAQGKNKQGAQCSLPYFKDNLQDDEYQKCRNCGGELVFKSHQQITEKQLRQPYYFSKWLFCKNCNAVFFDEKDKVFKNGKPMSPFYGYGKKDSWTPPPANWREIALAKERGLTT